MKYTSLVSLDQDRIKQLEYVYNKMHTKFQNPHTNSDYFIQEYIEKLYIIDQSWGS